MAPPVEGITLDSHAGVYRKSGADAVVCLHGENGGQENITAKDSPSNIEGISCISLLATFAKEKSIFNINHKGG